ncbi:MAG: LysR substrate-binding domain-containing protein [Pseudomonadota bacterium]
MTTTDAGQIPLLELDLLKTLVAIADTGNFSAAAESVFRTPSAVSMQVKKLEELVGKPLFTRDSRSVSPTPDGELLLEHGRRLLALNRDMVAQFHQPQIQGVVRLGAPDDVAERWLPAMLRRFAETHCCVTVDVLVDNSTRLRQLVHKGQLDLCLYATTPGDAKKHHAEVLVKEPLVWAGAQNGVAWEQDPLPISVWEESCSWRAAAINSLQKRKRNYRIAFMSAHISGQRAAMLADLAVAPIPLSSCGEGVVCLGKKQGLPALGDYALALDMTDKPSEAVHAAADHLRASLSSKAGAA